MIGPPAAAAPTTSGPHISVRAGHALPAPPEWEGPTSRGDSALLQYTADRGLPQEARPAQGAH